MKPPHVGCYGFNADAHDFWAMEKAASVARNGFVIIP